MSARSVGSPRLVLWACAAIVSGAFLIGIRLFVSSMSEVEQTAPISLPAQANTPARSVPVPVPESKPTSPPADPIGTSQQIPMTSLPLRLLATIHQEDPRLSLAQVEDIQHAKRRLMKQGQVFEDRPQVTLMHIEQGSVLLDNYGVHERLMLDPDGQRLSQGLGFDLEATTKAELSEEARERRRELSQRLQALMSAGAEYELRRETGGLLSEAVVRPKYDEWGQLTGIQLSEIQPGSVYERVGLQDGDVLTSVNGIPIGSPLVAPEFVTQLVESQEIAVGVEKDDGSKETVIVPLGQLVEEFQPFLEGNDELLPGLPVDAQDASGD